MPKKVIIDCDPGIDDAFALLLAHGDEQLDLVAITTVAGNQTLEKVTTNALAIASVGGIDGVPIAAGASGKDKYVAVRWVQLSKDGVGDHPDAAHRRDGIVCLGYGDDTEGLAGEAAGAQIDKQKTDLRVVERVEERDVCDSVAQLEISVSRTT